MYLSRLLLALFAIAMTAFTLVGPTPCSSEATTNIAFKLCPHSRADTVNMCVFLSTAP